ncbi:hypothetical protein [Lentibacillus amyloliquefaciens]|uniref:hypothetical protein n=1 Tax=Lentibacillus amyloliquefaciens TaxID=1472767 RepID=UPI0012E39346|nr:hypothetical protein [Lentibacillus amyloliquefaciens]
MLGTSLRVLYFLIGIAVLISNYDDLYLRITSIIIIVFSGLDLYKAAKNKSKRKAESS